MDIKAKENMNLQAGFRSVKQFSVVLPDDFVAGLEVGDTIVFNKEMGPVFERVFGTHRAQCMVVTLRHANGTTEAYNWFPASIVKPIFPVEAEDGKVVKNLRPIYHVGTAVNMIKACRGRGAEKGTTDLQLAVNQFLGHEILVESADTVLTERWKDGQRTGEAKETKVYTYTFVKKDDKKGE